MNTAAKDFKNVGYGKNEKDEEKEPLKTLFVVEDYMTEKEIEKLNRKRGTYKKKEHKFDIVTNPYTEMKNLYEKLAGFMPVPLFSNKTEVFCCSKVRIWHYVYNRDRYSYHSEDFEGEDFKVIEAEIIGTENFYIDDRIKIHKELIHLLSGGVELEKALDSIQPMIQKAKGAV